MRLEDRRDEGRQWTVGISGGVEADMGDSSYSVRFKFPERLFKAGLGRQRTIPATVSAIRLGPGREWEPRSGTLVPLQLALS
jgi:hypothetical protein